ncbi:MAG: RAMP superfamily CRISPR-associated protein [Pseudomonadota bacterium]
MSTCFDALADETWKQASRHPVDLAQLARRNATTSDRLTQIRAGFLTSHAIENPRDAKGRALPLACRRPKTAIDPTPRSASEALAGFPRYSARLLLRFRLTSPLLTRDDDPFHLFDNPARKDHITGLPYLAAASVKGLSADAYQRAFPGAMPWIERDPKGNNHDRVRHFRREDDSALRLFGLADDGEGEPTEGHAGRSRSGRLRFSPAWFDKLEYLVLNPADPKTATGTLPIQFEAIARDQESIIEVVYFNPYPAATPDEPGSASDLDTVRADLARWLAAVATWWPVLGLGAKRLAGYGTLEITEATLEAVDWPGLGTLQETATQKADPAAHPEAPKSPAYYGDWLNETGQPVEGAVLEDRVRVALAKADAEIIALEQKWQAATKKDRPKLKDKLEKARKAREGREKELRGQHRNVLDFWTNDQPKPADEATSPAASALPPITLRPIGTRTETGLESWLKLAQWIAEGTQP